MLKKRESWFLLFILPIRDDYSWSDFFVEFNLDMEVSCIHQKNKKIYFVCMGMFSKACFTILEQIRQKKSIRISGICSTQADLIKNIATEDIEPLDFTTSDNGDSTKAPEIEGELEATKELMNSHFTTILQLHIFGRIVKPGIDSEMLMSLIDRSKLQDGVSDLLSAFHESNCNKQKKAMELIAPSGTVDDPCLLSASQSDKIFPSLKSHGIPLYKGAIQNVLRDIMNLMKLSGEKDLLTYPLFNEAVCSLVHVPSSSSYSHFKKNAKRTKWIEKVLALLNSSNSEDDNNKEEAA